MCALLPRILRFRSELNPPITLMAPESENDPSATAKIDRPLMSVRNPLFLRAHVARGDVRRERPALEQVEQPGQQSDHRPDHEEDARDDGAGADEHVAQRPRRAAQLGQLLGPERQAEEQRRRARRQSSAGRPERSPCAAKSTRARQPRNAIAADDGREARDHTGAGSVFTSSFDPGPPRAAAGERG